MALWKTGDYYAEIGEAIREKLKTEKTFLTREMADEIRSIQAADDIPFVDQAIPKIGITEGGLVSAVSEQEAGRVEGGTKISIKQLPVQEGKTIIPTEEEQIAAEAGVWTAGRIVVAPGAPVYEDVLPSIGITVDEGGKVTATLRVNEGHIAETDTGVTHQLPVAQGQVVTPGTSAVTISGKKYLTDDILILGDSDLVPGNIRRGVNIFGVVGTMRESGAETPGTATPDVIFKGYIAWVNGERVVGTYVPWEGGGNIPGLILADFSEVFLVCPGNVPLAYGVEGLSMFRNGSLVLAGLNADNGEISDFFAGVEILEGWN